MGSNFLVLSYIFIPLGTRNVIGDFDYIKKKRRV